MGEQTVILYISPRKRQSGFGDCILDEGKMTPYYNVRSHCLEFCRDSLGFALQLRMLKKAKTKAAKAYISYLKAYAKLIWGHY